MSKPCNLCIVVCGSPGAGKSAVADAAARRFAEVYGTCMVFRTDAFRKRLFPGEGYAREQTNEVYRATLAAAAMVAETERAVVLDGTFHSTSRCEDALDAMPQHVVTWFVHVAASKEKRLANLRGRTEADACHSEYTAALLADSAFNDRPCPVPHVRIDGDQSWGDVWEDVAHVCDQWIDMMEGR